MSPISVFAIVFGALSLIRAARDRALALRARDRADITRERLAQIMAAVDAEIERRRLHCVNSDIT
jgi:hypothetical protein